jgi:branched-chain amino acid transport system ATP-binding protein
MTQAAQSHDDLAENRAENPVLEVRGLTAGYGDLAAIRDVSFKLFPGEIVALVGANGAGKTTMLLSTVGVLPRMSGAVLWRGAPAPQSLPRFARCGMAFVPAAPTVIHGLSTRDNLRLGSGGVDMGLRYMPELEELLDRRAGLLSGGEQQMLAMARALASRPEALLVDELSLGLAPLVGGRLLDALRKGADTDGLAVLLVEQQVRKALAVADRWQLLSNGVIADSGRATDHARLEASYLAGMSHEGAPSCK